MKRTLVAAFLTAQYLLVSCSESEPSDQLTPPTNKEASGQQKPPAKANSRPNKPTPPKSDEPNRPKKTAQQGKAPAEDPNLITWPRDKQKVLARVAGRDITLEQLLAHIDAHLQKGFLKKTPGSINQHLRTKTLIFWTRQLSILKALEALAADREVAPSRITLKRQQAATSAFTEWMAAYMIDYRKRTGRDYPSRVDQIDGHRARFLFRNGLKLEVEGVLNAILPNELTQAAADNIHRSYAQIFNGFIDISTITVANRDRKTGARMKGEAKKKYFAKVSDIQRRLKKDGSNFEDVADAFSEVKRSSAPGCVLTNVSRFHPSLPAVITRTAWGSLDGKWSGPVESEYGMHFVKRIRFHNKSMILRLDPTNKEIRRFIRQFQKENLVFKALERFKVEFVY